VVVVQAAHRLLAAVVCAGIFVVAVQRDTTGALAVVAHAADAASARVVAGCAVGPRRVAAGLAVLAAHSFRGVALGRPVALHRAARSTFAVMVEAVVVCFAGDAVFCQTVAVAAARVAVSAYADVSERDKGGFRAVALVAALRVGALAVAPADSRDHTLVDVPAVGAIAAYVEVSERAAAARRLHGCHAQRRCVAHELPAANGLTVGRSDAWVGGCIGRRSARLFFSLEPVLFDLACQQQRAARPEPNSPL
jgi:hypothetical protein